MSRKACFNILKFDELDIHGRAKAIKDHTEFLRDVFDCRELTENFKSQLEEVGLPNKDVYWSLSYCQGDGVGFYGPVDNLTLLCKTLGIQLPPESETNDDGQVFGEIMTFEIKKIGWHYNHECSGRVLYEVAYYSGNYPDAWDKLAEEIAEQMQSAYHDWSIKLRNQGYAEMEYQQEEEYVIDSILANEYEFYPDGTIYHRHGQPEPVLEGEY